MGWLAATAVAVCVMCGLLSARASADQTVIVTRMDDPPPGTCNNQDCSLRSAILVANSFPDEQTTIELTPGSYTLSIPGATGNVQGDLDIAANVTIETTTGADARIVQTQPERVMEIHNRRTTLRNISPWFGTAPTEGTAEHGGGIRVDAGSTLEMHGGNMEFNTAADPDPINDPVTPGFGGAIYSEGVTELDGVEFSNNQTDFGFGGGVDSVKPSPTVASGDGDAIIDNSVFTSNSAGFGGAVSSLGGNLTLRRSYLADNKGDFGGAAYIAGGGANIENTTMFGNGVANSGGGGNPAERSGGAIRDHNAALTLDNSTLTGNTAAAGGGISALADNGFAASVTLHNSILAGNTDYYATDGLRPDCSDETGGLFHTDGYNIVGNNIGCDLHPITGDQIGNSVTAVDAGVHDPAFNGGPVFGLLTDAFKPGSTALNLGDPGTGTCQKVDERGVPRHLGKRCDIGAYEQVSCHGVLVNLVGTNGVDFSDSGTMTPTPGADGILGLGGSDGLLGGDGPDGICGGPGLLDELSGENGADVLAGQGGRDELAGGPGDDRLLGGSGDDHLSGGAGNDHLVGGTGHDVCVGGPGHDTATGCEEKHGIP